MAARDRSPKPVLTKAPRKSHPAAPGPAKPAEAPTVAADEDLISFGTRIPKSLAREVRTAAVSHDRTVQEFVTEALREKLDRM